MMNPKMPVLVCRECEFAMPKTDVGIKLMAEHLLDEHDIRAEVDVEPVDPREEVLTALACDWHLLKHHHPVGAYLPVGQLDGDCRCGKGTWPCDVVRQAVGL